MFSLSNTGRPQQVGGSLSGGVAAQEDDEDFDDRPEPPDFSQLLHSSIARLQVSANDQRLSPERRLEARMALACGEELLKARNKFAHNPNNRE